MTSDCRHGTFSGRIFAKKSKKSRKLEAFERRRLCSCRKARVARGGSILAVEWREKFTDLKKVVALGVEAAA